MKPKLLLAMFALLTILTGCLARPSAVPDRQNPTSTDDRTPDSSSGQVTEPQNQAIRDGTALDSSNSQGKPLVAGPTQNPSGKAVGVRIWAVDTAGKEAFEMLYDNHEPGLAW